MIDNSISLTKYEFEGLKPYIQDAIVFVNGENVLMTTDDYLIAVNLRLETEREDMNNYSFT